MSNASNYYQYLKPLFYFDSMVTGVAMNHEFDSSDITDDDYLILSNLAQHKFSITFNKYPQYVNNTFQSYTNNKTQIVINLDYIEYFFNKLQDLILYDVQSKAVNKGGDSKCNLLKPTVFKLFHNV
eukprot:165917_1